MATKEIEIIGYCDELVSTNESEGTQLRRVIGVLQNHVWIYLMTYTIEKGRRIGLPHETRNMAKALMYLSKAVENNETIVSYELFGDTVKKVRNND